MRIDRPSPSAVSAVDLGKGGEQWLSTKQFAVLLGILLVACFPHVLAGLETFYYVDFSTFGYPLAFYHRESFWKGEIPLWNPLNNCGMPFLAQWNTLTLYPLSLIYLLLPMPWSVGFYEIFHLLIAGVGMFTLARRWTGSGVAAAVAGTVYSFNGLTWFGLMWPNNIAALGWLPWVVFAVEEGWRHGGARLLIGALIGAVQLLSGAPEVCLQTWLFLAALWVCRVFQSDQSRQELLWRGLGTVILIACLAAAQLLPFIDLLLHSQRNVNFGDAQSMAMPIWGWANYLVPLFRTVHTRQGMYFQPEQGWTASYYTSLAALALAFWALLRVRQPKVYLLSGTALLCLLLAFGQPGLVYPVVAKLVPVLGFMRYPVKFVVLVTFALPLLAAYAVAALEARESKLDKKLLIGICLALGLGIAAILWFAWSRPLPTDDLKATLRNGFGRAAFLAAFVGVLLLAFREKQLKLRRLLLISLVPLLWFDVFTHSANLSPTVPQAVLAPGTIRQYFGWTNELLPGTSRALQEAGSLRRMLVDSKADPVMDVNGRRLSLFFNANLLEGIPKFDGFYSLDVREFSDMFRAVYQGTNTATPLKAFLGISHQTNPTNSVDWIRLPERMPLITAGQQPVFASDDRTLASILSERFNPQEMVFVPESARPEISAQRQTGAVVSGYCFAAQKIEANIQAPTPTMVAISQTYYHPWKAYVDSKPTRLYRANYAFQAVQVPEGTHTLRLQYEDNFFRIGVLLSVGALLFIAVAFFRNHRRPGYPETV